MRQASVWLSSSRRAVWCATSAPSSIDVGRSYGPHPRVCPARYNQVRVPDAVRLVAVALFVLGTANACSPLPGAAADSVESPSSNYVGLDSCRDCHEGNFVNFSRTGMGRSFYPMSSTNIVEDFVKNNELGDPRTGVRYRMFERDGRFYQRQFVLDGEGNEFAVDEYELTYVVGSNNHSRGYITLRDGKLFQAPICWDPTKEFWMFCPGFEYQNDHFGREISARCIFCHNGRVELVEGERNLYHEPLTMGIGCERCHGPGETHLACLESKPADPWGDPGSARSDDRQPGPIAPQATAAANLFPVSPGRHERNGAGGAARSLAGGLPSGDGDHRSARSIPLRAANRFQLQPRLAGGSHDPEPLLPGKRRQVGVPDVPQPAYPGVRETQRSSFRDNCMICHDLEACVAPD